MNQRDGYYPTYDKRPHRDAASLRSVESIRGWESLQLSSTQQTAKVAKQLETCSNTFSIFHQFHILGQYFIPKGGRQTIQEWSTWKYKVHVTVSFVCPYRRRPKHYYLCMFHRELLLYITILMCSDFNCFSAPILPSTLP